MENITSASWVERMGGLGLTNHVWIRIDPPTRAWKSGLGDLDIIDHRGHMHTNKVWATVMVFDTSSVSGDYLIASALAPDLSSDETQDGQTTHPWTITPIEVNGRKLIRYQRTYLSNNYEIREIIDAEETSRYIVRKEERQYEPLTGVLVGEEICDQYRYNEPAPRGTFEMPWWKPKRTHDSKEAIVDVQDSLSEDERAQIERAIIESDLGWEAGDFQRFAGHWRFAFAPLLPDENEWRQAVEEQRGRWKWWSSNILSVRKTETVGIPQSAHSFLMAKIKPAGFAVAVESLATWQDEEIWSGPTSYTFAAMDEGLRIIYWDVPIDEIIARHEGR